MIWKVERWDWDRIKKIGWWTKISFVNEKEAEQLIQNYREHGVCARAISEFGEIGCTKTSSWKLKKL